MLIPLGFGGLSSALAVSFGKYRGVFIVLTLVLLGISHYWTYKKPNPSKINQVILWTATVVSVGMMLYSFINNIGR